MRAHTLARRMGLLTAAVAFGFSVLIGLAAVTAGTAGGVIARGADTDDSTWNSLPEGCAGNGVRDDFTWNSVPDDFTWNSVPDDFTWNGVRDDFTWNNVPDDFTWN